MVGLIHAIQRMRNGQSAEPVEGSKTNSKTVLSLTTLPRKSFRRMRRSMSFGTVDVEPYSPVFVRRGESCRSRSSLRAWQPKSTVSSPQSCLLNSTSGCIQVSTSVISKGCRKWVWSISTKTKISSGSARWRHSSIPTSILKTVWTLSESNSGLRWSQSRSLRLELLGSVR